MKRSKFGMFWGMLSSILFCSTIYAGLKNNNSLNDTLAIIGNQVITVENYISSYKMRLLKLGLSDTLDTRKGYLLNLMQDEILIFEAIQSGLDRTSEAQLELIRIQTQELLNFYSNKYISTEINITDDNLSKLFSMMNTKLKARHLYADSKDEVDYLYFTIESHVLRA